MNLRHIIPVLLLLFSFTLSAQNEIQKQEGPVELDSVAETGDPFYREDQIYASISYNLMQGKPDGYKQNSVSTGLTLGVLRDFPVNASRTHAIAVGLGYSYNNIKHNLLVTETPVGNTYDIEREETFDRNKLVLQYVELPLEFRWRNSTASDHKFWRVYLGVKASYLFYDKARFEDYENIGRQKVKGDDNLNKLLFSTYLSAGWNTWNLYACYGITPIYKDAVTDTGEKLKLNSLNLGLIFYIL